MEEVGSFLSKEYRIRRNISHPPVVLVLFFEKSNENYRVFSFGDENVFYKDIEGGC